MSVNSGAMKIATDINKVLGDGTVVLGSEVREIKRIPSGSLALDVILGGGYPANQWVEIVGEPSHGKTALALKMIAQNQKLNPDFTAVWVAAEPWSEQYARLCGVDPERVIIVETNLMEDVYDSVIKFADSRTVDCVVIDSLPALVPTTEDAKDSGEMTVGRGALLTNQFFRKVGRATKRSLVTDERPFLGVIINQYRMKIGTMYGDPRTTPGGQGKDYAYFVRLEVRRDEWIEVGTGDAKKRIGQSMKVRTIKNKSAPPQQVAYVDFYFEEGGPVFPGEFDYAKEIVALGVLYGIFERKGTWLYYGDRKWQGATAALNSLREEIDLKDKLEREVLEVVLRQNAQ